MCSPDFGREAFVAGTFVALATGLLGWFVVLRTQLFAGDALSHVAFTGALAAAAAGIDVRVGLFAATAAGALGMGALGRRGPAPDGTTRSGFARGVGLRAPFPSIFTP